MVPSAIAAPSGSYPVSSAPTTVVISVGFVVAAVVSDPYGAVDSHALHRAGLQQGQSKRPQSDSRPEFMHGVHFGSTLVSVSLHSINPTGAPAGSATTATMPPWRSACGSTSTRPPRATALAVELAVSSTRTKFSQ